MRFWQSFAICFLLAEAVGGAVWWLLLLVRPATRALFIAKDAPDVTLWAFAVADGLLFIGSAAAAAYGIRKHTSWAWPLLCIHSGAGAYAALYCWTLTVLTAGDGATGAALMTPSLIVPSVLIWQLRPAA